MIRITRKREWMNYFGHYEIFIDGKFRGLIGNNETHEFEVENGSHIVRAEIDWCRSNELHVHVNDSIVELDVGCSVRGWRILLVRLYVTIWRNKCLFLKEGDGILATPKRPTPKWLQKIYDVIENSK